MWFSGFEPLLRTLVIGTLTYAGLILSLRISGKRTLSKMNAFDFVVTVALGSVFASALIDRNVDLAQSMAAVILLIALQFLVSWTSVRFEPFQRLVKSEPALIMMKGEVLPAAKRERVSKEEIVAAIRAEGYARVEDVDAVVLETDGSFSIFKTANPASDSSFANVAGRASKASD